MMSFRGGPPRGQWRGRGGERGRGGGDWGRGGGRGVADRGRGGENRGRGGDWSRGGGVPDRGRGGFEPRGRGGDRGRGFTDRGRGLFRGGDNRGRGGFDGQGGLRGRGGRGGGQPGERPGAVKTKLHVRNIADGISEIDIKQLFNSVGEVVECDIVKDFAFVHYGSAEEANQAVTELNGTMLGGQAIEIKFSRSNMRQQPGITKDQCFRCGSFEHWSDECEDRGPNERRGRGGPRGGRERGRGGPMRGRDHGNDRFNPYPPSDDPSAYPAYDPSLRDPNFRLRRIRRLEQAYRRALLEARAEELGLDPYSDEFMDEIAGRRAATVAPPPGAREAGVAREPALAESVPPPQADDPFSRPPADYYAQRRSLDRPESAEAGYSDPYKDYTDTAAPDPGAHYASALP